MGKRQNLTGQKYGKLTAIEEVGKSEQGSYLWRWSCECGGSLVSVGAVIKNGNTSSCGCLRKEALVKRNTTHNMSKHPAYSNWKDMFKRCYNEKNKRYADYHERGIGVDPAFRNFPDFLAEIGEKPDEVETWTIGRIDNNKSYEPGNVRWETLTEQARNHSMQKNNTSGIVGVRHNIKTNKHGTYESWVAVYSDENKKHVSRTFSVKKYGYEEAKRLAIEAREEGIKRLEGLGIFYGETHGTAK